MLLLYHEMLPFSFLLVLLLYIFLVQYCCSCIKNDIDKLHLVLDLFIAYNISFWYMQYCYLKHCMQY